MAKVLKRGVVYLIHFERPFKHARHYIGFAGGKDHRERIERHRNGRGARLLQVLNEHGIGYRVVRVWRNVTRDFERKLKNSWGGHKDSLCPACSGVRAHARGCK
jgi:predicted GIY-YIG superfamily endonuclease